MNSFKTIIYAILSVCIFFNSYCAAQNQITYYVAPNGNDQWTGTLQMPNSDASDGPLATMNQALKKTRELKTADSWPEKGVSIIMADGIYELDTPIILNENDSGTANAPLTIKAAKPKQAWIIGGKPITGFQPVTDSTMLKQIPQVAHDYVVFTNLKEQGIDDFGQLTARGFGRPMHTAALELFFDNQPMTLARYPNEGWMKIAEVPEGENSGQFQYSDETIDRWANTTDVWLHGFWKQEWADSYVNIKEINTETKTIFTKEPHGVYGYVKDKRFYALNILQELDQPGEWYLDRESGDLFFWSPKPVEDHKAVVSILDEPLFQFNNASHIKLEGIHFAFGRQHGVSIDDGSQVLLQGCTFANLGNKGVVADGGTHHEIRDCDIYHTGDGGIDISGGDRSTLTSAEHQVVNNHIHQYSRWVFTYRPAISVNGVGIRVAHNLLHDAPHSAIQFGGNNHIFEYNDIHTVCYESGDVGAIYTGRNWTTRGHIIRHNYIHDLEGPYTYGAKSVYLDDAASGVHIYGNVFERSDEGAFIGGGRDNIVENNLFLDCDPAVHVDSRGTGWAAEYIQKGGSWNMYEKLEQVNYQQPPYSEAYPELVNILENRPHEPIGTVIKKNISFGGRWLNLQNNLAEKDILTFENNLVFSDLSFESVEAALEHLSTIKDELNANNIEAIPFEKIGLVSTPFRH